MAALIECAVAALPCPPDQQQAVTELTAELLAQLGFTPDAVLSSIAFGMAIVITPSLVALAVRVAVRVVRQA